MAVDLNSEYILNIKGKDLSLYEVYVSKLKFKNSVKFVSISLELSIKIKLAVLHGDISKVYFWAVRLLIS